MKLILQSRNSLIESYLQAAQWSAAFDLCEETLTLWGSSSYSDELLNLLFCFDYANSKHCDYQHIFEEIEMVSEFLVESSRLSEVCCSALGQQSSGERIS